MTRELVAHQLYGVYHDRLLDAHGRLILDRGWQKNVIVTDCRRILAGLMRRDDGMTGIQELRYGRGLPEWDENFVTADASQAELVDNDPIIIPAADLQFSYVQENGSAAATPTNRLQIYAKLGANQPPEGRTLREFGLVGHLNGAPALINYVRHLPIIKDVASTLERTIWLTF
jgi:hypothetical protein